MQGKPRVSGVWRVGFASWFSERREIASLLLFRCKNLDDLIHRVTLTGWLRCAFPGWSRCSLFCGSRRRNRLLNRLLLLGSRMGFNRC